MRLIDADALLITTDHLPFSVNGAAWLQAIENTPTADAVPVVRGEWNNTYNSGYRPNPENVCSVCDCWNVRRSDYCPNCGAKMDGKRKESEVSE